MEAFPSFFLSQSPPQKRYHFDLAEMGGSPMSQVQVSSLPMEFCVVRNEDTLTGLCVSWWANQQWMIIFPTNWEQMSNKVGVEHQAVEFEINEWYGWINILIETDCLSMGEFFCLTCKSKMNFDSQVDSVDIICWNMLKLIYMTCLSNISNIVVLFIEIMIVELIVCNLGH